jgi:hypothetical protein
MGAGKSVKKGNIMRGLITILAVLLSCITSHGATITAANPGPVAVSNAMVLVTAAGAGNTLAIPAGTSNWTYGIAWTAPANTTIQGAGTSATGGGQQTVIVDDSSAIQALLDITIPSAGVFRLTGSSFIGGSGGVKDQQGVILLRGSTSSPSQFRIDHCTFDMHTYSPELGSGTHIMNIYDSKGVIDHCYIKPHFNDAFYLYRSGASGYGDEVWAAATGFGSDDFYIFEDNIGIGGETSNDAGSFPSRLWDLNGGAKAVARFNDFYFMSAGEHHETGHAGNDRGGRASESYGNIYHQGTNQNLSGRVANAVSDAKSGANLIWGNTIDAGAINTFGIFNTTRRNTATYAQSINPDGWGYVGPAPITNGTVGVIGTAVTKTTGPDFNVNWPAGTVIYIAGASCDPIVNQEPNPGPSCIILSVNSTTSITLTNGGHSGGNLTGAAYSVGSRWDGNTDFYGYPALDQAGRGVGDLITGTHPTKINSVSGIISWPNQALEPVYFWNNSGTPVTVDYSNGSSNLVVAQRDFYPQASGIQTTPTSPFNGVTNVGWGTLANRPTTCTPGVAYFATDQGSWNTSTTNYYGVQQNGADGVLYKATATDTWTLYYTPYTYPHPLITPEAAGDGVTGTKGPPLNKRIKTRR